jgi:hypothetical protein
MGWEAGGLCQGNGKISASADSLSGTFVMHPSDLWCDLV